MLYEYTLIKKERIGWKAETEISLGAGEMNGETGTRILKFSTYKGLSGYLHTTASSCLRVVKDGYRVEKHMVGLGSEAGDYHQSVTAHHGAKKITKKAVKDAHESAMALFGAHIAAAKTKYGVKGAA